MLASQKKIESILYIDDDDDDAIMLEAAIKALDRSIRFIKSYGATDAINFLKSAALLPDLIFLDLNMPRINGFECLKELKTIEHAKEIPVVMLSTSANKKDVDAALTLGAIKFLTKPNTYRELCGMLQPIIAAP